MPVVGTASRDPNYIVLYHSSDTKDNMVKFADFFATTNYLSNRFGGRVDPLTVLGATDETFRYFGLYDWYNNDYYAWPDGELPLAFARGFLLHRENLSQNPFLYLL